MCPRLRPKACAARAGCSEKSIYTAINSGALPAIRINARVILIDEDDLKVWLENCRTAPPMVGRPNGAVAAQRASR